MTRIYNLIIFAIIVVALSSCYVTKHIPKTELLYTGNEVKFADEKNVKDDEMKDEIDAALYKTPSTTIAGGFVPIPFKMWSYNSLVKYKSGLGKWLFNRLAANPPVYVSTVNPEVRAKIATNLLKDYGHFNGKVSYDVVHSSKDSLKAKVVYSINAGIPYIITELGHKGFDKDVLDIMRASENKRLVNVGEKFNVLKLDSERNRLSAELRNKGYFYFRPEYITFEADTTIRYGGYISLRAIPAGDLPKEVEKPYNIGSKTVNLLGKNGEEPNDSIRYKNLNIRFHNKLRVRPNILYRWINYKQFLYGKQRNVELNPLYNQKDQEAIQERLSSLGIFNYVDYQYEIEKLSFKPLKFNFQSKDSLADNNSSSASEMYIVGVQNKDSVREENNLLSANIYAALAKPLDAEIEFNFVTKSNNQTGPGVSFGINRHNIFGGGERLGFKIKGSYEWQTGVKELTSVLNSWEFGTTISLYYPRVVFPYLNKLEFQYPASTTFKLNANQLNRAKYYKLLSFGGEVTYDFKPTRSSHHSITPLNLSFNLLQKYYDKFSDIVKSNPVLYLSFQDQFIPAMEYTYTFSNNGIAGVRNPIWWQSTIKSAGNITSLIYKAAGHDFNKKDKRLFGAPFAQFVKLSSEFRYLWNIDRNNKIATRTAVGAMFSYGNSEVAPYIEHFYVGGANSIRAFTVRSIGPGGYHPSEGKYSYLDQVGSFRFESNLEFRFRMFRNLWGATFLDAGNVWMLQKAEERPNSELRINNFFNQIALGTGFGVRYDMDILVFRLDFGVPLHFPYDTGKKGYYNVTGKFLKNIGFHFAIGYPF